MGPLEKYFWASRSMSAHSSNLADGVIGFSVLMTATAVVSKCGVEVGKLVEEGLGIVRY